MGNAMKNTIRVLSDLFGHEHPFFDKSAWSHEVSNDETVLGYWEWVIHQIEGVDSDAGMPDLWNACLKWLHQTNDQQRRTFCEMAFAAGYDGENDSILVDVLYHCGWPVQVMDSSFNTIQPVKEFAWWCNSGGYARKPVATRSVGDQIGEASERIASILMSDVIGDYDVPDNVPEWEWVEKHACYKHVKNGTDGIWEFVLNLSVAMDNIPASLIDTINVAKNQGLSYIIFHQGT